MYQRLTDKVIHIKITLNAKNEQLIENKYIHTNPMNYLRMPVITMISPIY